MKHNKLTDALNEISDDYIDQASRKYPRRHRFPWVGAVAAVLVLALGIGFAGQPAAEKNDAAPQDMMQEEIAYSRHEDYLLAEPTYPEMLPYPHYTGAADEAVLDSWDAYLSQKRQLHDQPEGYADNLQAYFSALIPKVLSGHEGENVSCSPVNLYMALAMLAETTGAESRQQLLDLLRAKDIEALRRQAGQVFNAHYYNDGLTTSVLGTSLWLHEDVSYNEATVKQLAESYYASVFRGKLGTEPMNQALQSWLNEHTGGLLQDQVKNVELSPNSNLAIATTILYQVQWIDEFQEKNNTQAVFHGVDGDTTETFMNRQLTYGPYYWSDNFGAVYLSLEDGSRMWLLLPDEGFAPEEILEEAGAFFAQKPYAYDSGFENQKDVIVNLSLPKFDIASDMDLVDKLKELGVTDIFDAQAADFSPLILLEDGGFVDKVQHATRVSIDEKGVTAAAFTVIDRCGAGMPPQEEIDFTLDRPFAFYIESQDGLPLFAGVVNEP